MSEGIKPKFTIIQHMEFMEKHADVVFHTTMQTGCHVAHRELAEQFSIQYHEYLKQFDLPEEWMDKHYTLVFLLNKNCDWTYEGNTDLKELLGYCSRELGKDAANYISPYVA